MSEPSSSNRRLRAVVTPESIRSARELALTGNFDQAVALAHDKLQYDLSPIEVLVALYLPVLREVGELWHVNTIAHQDQAVASRVCDHVLDQVWPSSAVAGPHRGSVIVAAPPGEEHTFAGRLAALSLLADGWSVIDLGADVPVADMEAACESSADLQGIVVHGAATSSLPGALHLIDAAAGRGVGVVVGGRGFGEGGCYGSRLGASAWAEHPGRAVSVLLPAAVTSHPGPGPDAREACAEVLRRAAAIAGKGPCPFAEVMPADAVGPLAPGPFFSADLAAAVLVDSPELMADSVRWYCDFVAARGVATTTLGAVLEALWAAMADLSACDAPLIAARAALP